MQYKSIHEIIAHLESDPAETGGNIYHPIPFPEFAHLKTSSDAEQVRAKWEMIQAGLRLAFPAGMAGRKVLDVGANCGFYAFSLAQQGATVTAFEPHPRYGPIGEFLAAEKKLPVQWNAAAISAEAIRGRRFDVALMLSVFQWMADGGKNLTAASADLRAVSESSDHLVFELGFNRGKSCLTTSRRNQYGALLDLLRETTGYEHYKLLGQPRIWRRYARFLVLCSHRADLEDSLLRRWTRGIRI